MKKFISFVFLIVLVINVNSCGIKPVGLLEGVFRSLFSNDGLICHIPLLSNVIVDVTGACRINKINHPTLQNGIGDDNVNYDNNPISVPESVTEEKTIDATSTCYIHLWDFDKMGSYNLTTIHRATKEEVLSAYGKSRGITEANWESYAYGCDHPKIIFEERGGNGSRDINVDLDKYLQSNLFNRVFSFTSDGESEDFKITYNATAYCDDNNDDLFTTSDRLIQRKAPRSVEFTMNYDYNEITEEATVTITQSDSLSLIWKNDPSLYVPGKGITATEECPAIGDPLVIDFFGNGFKFERLKRAFDYNVDGIKDKWYCIKADNNDDAFLVLDIDGNGIISDGSELFGNYTTHYLVPRDPSCRPSRTKNCQFYKKAFNPLPKQGFEALAVYDTAAAGGNEDGWIGKEDAIYSYLRLGVQNPTGSSFFSKMLPIAVTDMRIKLRDIVEMDEIDPVTRNKTRWRSIVTMSNPPMVLKDLKTGHIKKVTETVIADIWFEIDVGQ